MGCRRWPSRTGYVCAAGLVAWLPSRALLQVVDGGLWTWLAPLLGAVLLGGLALFIFGRGLKFYGRTGRRDTCRMDTVAGACAAPGRCTAFSNGRRGCATCHAPAATDHAQRRARHRPDHSAWRGRLRWPERRGKSTTIKLPRISRPTPAACAPWAWIRCASACATWGGSASCSASAPSCGGTSRSPPASNGSASSGTCRASATSACTGWCASCSDWTSS
jgi:hypothetical protein